MGHCLPDRHRGFGRRCRIEDFEYVASLFRCVLPTEIAFEAVRYSERYSEYTQAARPEHVAAQQELIEFFVFHYIKLLGRTKLRYLLQRPYDAHLFTHRGGEVDGSWWMLEQSTKSGTTSTLDSTIRHTDMCGFDLAIAISQTSINNQLRLRFRACETLRSWTTGDAVVEVKTISVMLLPDSRAVVTVYVTEAFLSDKLLDETSTKLVGECV